MSVSAVHDCPLIGSAHAAPEVDDDPALVDHADGSTNFTEFIEVPYECVFDGRKAWIADSLYLHASFRSLATFPKFSRVLSAIDIAASTWTACCDWLGRDESRPRTRTRSS